MSTSETHSEPKPSAELANKDAPKGKGAKFWVIFLTLNLSLFLSALEVSAISTSLPTIANALEAIDFVWIGSAYALAGTAFLPLCGGLAEIFGRRPALLTCLSLFAIGSAVCGASKNLTMMLAGRTIQGLGGGGIQSVSNIILADLVSLQERGLFATVFGLTWTISNIVGPLIGGSLASNNAWRWIFYLNLPLSGLAILTTVVFMKLPTPPGTFSEKFRKLDWIGNILVIGGTTVVSIALTWAGIRYSWGSAQVLAPLIVGAVGFVAFMLYEAFLATYPLIPREVVSNRTSISGYLQTFFAGLYGSCVFYYIPVYFQACKDASPIRSGIYALAFTIAAPSAMVAGALVKKTGRYRPQLWTGWVVVLIALGVLSTIEYNTNLGRTIGFIIIWSVGLGLKSSTPMFPIQAPLPVSLNAPALSFFQFSRSYSTIWGITIGGAILQNQLSVRLSSDFRATYPQGVAIAYAVIPTLKNLPEPLKTEVKIAFAESLRVVWLSLLGIAGVGFLSSFLMKGLPLHQHTDEKWAYEKKEAEPNPESPLPSE